MHKSLALATLSIFILSACGPVVVTSEKTPFIVETVSGRDLTREITLEKSALMKAGSQVSIAAQTSGRVGGVFVKPGDKILAGEIIARIEDTYGMTTNSREEAAISLQSARTNLASTTASLDQSLASAKIAYDKAQKDYDLARIRAVGDTSGEPTKAEIDLQNYIIAQEKQLEGYETTYLTQLQNFQTFLINVIDSTDILLWVTRENEEQNDSYEYLLGALDSSKKWEADDALRALLPYKNWTPDPTLPLLDRVREVEKVYLLASNLLASVETLLIKSITDATRFTETERSTKRALIDAYQSQYSGISTWLVAYYNSAQAFLATYQNDLDIKRINVQKAVQDAENNLELARNAYQTLEKTREFTIDQLTQSVASASIRLRSAETSISRLNITAPVDGVVGSVLVDVGEEITIGKPVVDMSSEDAEADITVDSSTLAQLQVGTKVDVNYRGQKLNGTVLSISPIADNGLNFGVKIGINADVGVFGDFATIDIPMTSPFPTLPITAVTILAPGQGEIWVLETAEVWSLSAVKKNVVLGSLWNDSVEITSDIAKDDVIILSDMKNYNMVDFVLEKRNS
jgi:multidrug resistance efflux pump